eukprot:TRINITY_DN48488_c0_g1_i1.p1 TRINITY_DN48488_c0_g1~~TRINITY_DN48488_c0_g1_i1.p1  ORF type:complete len:256 (-),score=32.50 TRINITY_DN48488_c0_g1_i1:17-784(-)
MDVAPSRSATKNLLEASGVRVASCHHWDPHPIVGLSALCFIQPAVAFFLVTLLILRVVPHPLSNATIVQLALYSILSLLFLAVTVTCALADYVYIKRGHRSSYGKIDIRLASATFVVCVFDFALRASLLETMVLVVVAMAAFMYSGQSTSFEQWVVRHTIWHVVAGADATYGALRLPPESMNLQKYPVCVWAISAGCAAMMTLALIGTLLLNLFCLKEHRASLWARGAAYGDWIPVEGLPLCKTADEPGVDDDNK